MADIHNDDARDLLELLAKSLAYPLANMFLGNAENGEVVIAVNPMWAERFGAVFPEITELQAFLHDHAWQPLDLWPEPNRAILRGQATGRAATTASTSRPAPTRSFRSCAVGWAASTRSRSRASERARCRARRLAASPDRGRRMPSRTRSTSLPACCAPTVPTCCCSRPIRRRSGSGSKLRFDDVSCAECVLAPDELVRTVTEAIGRRVPGEFELLLDDPRRP